MIVNLFVSSNIKLLSSILKLIKKQELEQIQKQLRIDRKTDRAIIRKITLE
ncbi:hypothetical protein TTHERM_00884650 (macronuclear) [Tetrahymena thermophila SB210]|uniref:Uncharacterized protein n=1 Tax=Tetrahymena thermophila (strain SB210) TaxID=312017 RepID=Q23A12_TETTS|nr:hypothetical protein TTHERM_00884650 [Tetrahymena thermophila SB210]EAR93351.1 hypothetical protein TTHERM_00884650 [Tetrahymena thermophila SB210]|eukprot:XP_001013596.1 hypothetical protein TTHERM_00884650 [Tetrahymena thermophila SB210]